METISKKINEAKPKPLYMQAAEKFDASYVYVHKIATGQRNATRGKGLLIKQWLLEQLVRMQSEKK